MMDKILILLMTSFVLLTTGTAGAADMEKGFLNYSWGDSASKYSGLTGLREKGDVSYYSKPGETYVVGNVSIDKVIYGFYKDQLFGVYLNLDTVDIFDKLFDHMKSQYGLPAYKTTSNDLIVYKWKQQDIIMKLKMNKFTQKMKLAFYFHPVSSKLNSSQWEDLDTSTFHFVPIEKDKKPEKFILFTF